MAVSTKRLALAAKLLAIGLRYLRLAPTVHAHLLALELAALRLLANLLTLHVPVLRLLANLLSAELPSLGLLAAMLTFDLTALRLLKAIAAHLLALNSRRPFGRHPLDAFRASLMSLRPHLDALRALHAWRGHLLEALRALHPRRGHSLSSLHPRSLALRAHLHSVSTGRLAVHARLALSGRAALVPVRPRSGRGGDRQCGDTRGEKYPGHHNFSF